MPSKWIGCIHRGQVLKGSSPRKETYWYDLEDKSCNAGSPEYNMQLRVKFWTEPTKQDLLSSVQRVRLPPVNIGAI